MSAPDLVNLALKEWAVVGDLVADGRCALLLRKGGVHEDTGPGRFRLEHQRFLLFPAWEHERLDWIKPDWLPPREKLRVDEATLAEPTTVKFRCVAETARIWAIPSRAAFERLDDLHPWAKPQVDMRFSYKPEQPLYLLLLRARRLEPAAERPNRAAFGGCRSWVPLDPADSVDVSAAVPAMPEERLAEIVRRVEEAFA